MPALYTRTESRAMRQRKYSVYGTFVWTTATCTRTFANNGSIFDDLDKTPRPNAFFDDTTPRAGSSVTSATDATDPSVDELWGRTTVTHARPLDIWLEPLPKVESETILPLKATEGVTVPTIEPSAALKQSVPSSSTHAVINAMDALRRAQFNRVVLHTQNVDSPEYMRQIDEEGRCIAALAAAQLPSSNRLRRSLSIFDTGESLKFFDDGFDETVRRRGRSVGHSLRSPTSLMD